MLDGEGPSRREYIFTDWSLFEIKILGSIGNLSILRLIELDELAFELVEKLGGGRMVDTYWMPGRSSAPDPNDGR
jgi:hypothetical protein